MQQLKIGFVGGGNMAEAMISGLIAAGHNADAICVMDTNPDRLDALQQQYGIVACSNSVSLQAASDVLLLAVKPQQIDDVLKQFAPVVSDKTVISIAAGISTGRIARILGDDVAVVRVMPNTPCLVGEGMSVLYSKADEMHRTRAEYILASSGQTAWIDEEQQMHAVTAVSGSGPAYFFLLAELMQAAGQSLGLSRELCETLVGQTALGAGRMLTESGKPAELLRQQVTSPGGTTQAALEAMFEGQLPDIVRTAIAAAARRSKELA